MTVFASKRGRLHSFFNLRWRGTIILAIPIICLLTSISTIAGLRSRTIAAREEELLSRQILLQSNRIVRTLEEAESSVRGYGLTQQSQFLDRYQQTKTEVGQEQLRLNRILPDDPQLQTQVNKIQSLARRQFALLDETIDLIEAAERTNTPSDPLTQQLLRNEAQMEQLGNAIASFSDRQQIQQQNYEQRVVQWRELTNRVQWLTLAVGLLATAASLYLFSRLERELSQGAESLRESNLRLQAVFENVVDGIIVFDPEGKIKDYNAAAARLFGDESLNLAEISFEGLVDTADSVGGLLGENNDRLGRFQETFGRRRNGNTFPMELAIAPLQWEVRPLFIAIVRDIGDRLQAEATLRKQAQLLEAANDAIIVRDPKERITYWNPAAENLYGWSAAQAWGQNVHELLKTEFPLPQEEIMAEFQGSGQWRGQLVQTCKKGDRLTVESTWSIQHDDRGNPIAHLEINKDITASKLAEETLRSHAAELARSTAILSRTTSSLEKRNQELDRFAYIVSHDLKAPLRAIANLSAWIEEDLEGQLDEETQHQMDLLRGRVHRMEALINGLLQYSRVGRMQSDRERVKVGNLLAEIVDSLDPPAGMNVEIEPPMPTFLTHRLPLQQVFTNLIGNAIQHHDRPEGTIRIAATEEEDHYRFSVADDGPGIEPQYHERIFVMFQTLQPRDRVESTGVGLAIVKKILDERGQKIWVESRQGEGTTFYFTWDEGSEQPPHQR